ncbi:MAG: ATP-binding protein, partial [Clostridiales bacterium]|nr:ATP-binding protein [Clostridiales bacterium]
MYTHLEIDNFRCFKNISMELKPITIIAGKNNAGKSSILDSLFLFQDYANSNVFWKLLGFRGAKQVNASERTLWEPLFHNMDTKEPIEIHLNDTHSLRLEKNNKYALSNSASGILGDRTNNSAANYALSCDFRREGERFAGDYLLGDGNMLLIGRNDELFKPITEFIQYLGPHVALDDNTVAEWLGKTELSQNKEDKKKLIDVLAILDRGIVDITTIAASGLVQLYITNE